MRSLSLAFIHLLTITVYSQNFWQPLYGPNAAEYVTQISQSPNSSLFLSTLGGGIYRSSDNGNTWAQKIPGFPGPVYDDGTVVFAFNSSGHIYSTSFTRGVWRSTNNGDSWLVTGLNNAFIVALDINQAGHVFAAQGGGGGIYRSIDNGISWIQVNNGLPQPVTFYSFVCKQGGTIFAGGKNYSGPCIYKSTNNGDYWQPAVLSNVIINSLALNINGDIFAGTDYNGVFRSTNNGDSWLQINNGLTSLRINQVYCNFQGYVFAASDSGLYRTTNSGINWLKIGFNNKNVSAALSLQNGSYFAGVYTEGIYRSTNNGANWAEANNGINSAVIYSLAINQSGNIFAGSDNKTVFRSADNGNSWQKQQSGLKGSYIKVLAAAPNNYLFAQSDSGTFRSTDNGSIWQHVYGGYFSFNDFAFYQNTHIFAAGSYPGFGVWVSTNNGTNWSPTNTAFSSSVYCLTISQSGYVFAGTAGGGIYKSTNLGVNWIQTGSGGSVHAIAAAPNGFIYAAIENVPQGSSGIYRSTNNGTAWQYMGLNIAYVSSIKINSVNHVYVSWLNGVYRSTNAGISWEQISSGLFNKMVFCMALNPQGYLYAGTWGNSVYKSVNTTIGLIQISSQIPREYALNQNYPNPFNASTGIEFSIPKTSPVRLVIYDILGGEVETLVNEKLNHGTYKAEWNASNYSSGVYFYKLTSESFTQTKKMILIK